jgi:membrane-bound lytic murein transglycosylase F
MKRILAFLPILSLFFLQGCTPFSEGVARKAEQSSTTEVPAGLASAIQGVEAYPDAPIDPSTRYIIKTYGPTIRRYAERYGFDWRLILAIMKQESRFEPHAESYKGASGLMQIMPVTQVELARNFAIKDLSHPSNNIRGGIYYLRKLYGIFDGVEQSDRLKLALAAYNAGLSRVYDAQDVAAYLHDNPRSWQAVRDALPLLARRYYTLHRNIWQQNRPRTGYFGNARETIAYVDSVMAYYDDFRLYLN